MFFFISETLQICQNEVFSIICQQLSNVSTEHTHLLKQFVYRNKKSLGLSVSLSVYLSIFLYLSLSLYLFLSVSVSLSSQFVYRNKSCACLSVSLFVSLSEYLFLSLSVSLCLSIFFCFSLFSDSLFTGTKLCLSVCISVCISLSLSLSVYLFLSLSESLYISLLKQYVYRNKSDMKGADLFLFSLFVCLSLFFLAIWVSLCLSFPLSLSLSHILVVFQLLFPSISLSLFFPLSIYLSFCLFLFLSSSFCLFLFLSFSFSHMLNLYVVSKM